MIRKAPGLKLSKKQLEILTALREFCVEHGHVPSVRELAQEVGRSATTVYQHLKALEKKGYLRSDGSAHGWQILRDDDLTGDQSIDSVDHVAAPEYSSAIEVPIRGSIAAGAPIDAIDNPDESLVASADVAKNGCYALRVRGQSMEDDHILDGDLVIIEPCQTVDNGTIAVALLDDGTATLKRIYRENHRIRLQPANSEMKPFYVDRVTIQGRVTGVVRRCS